MAADFTDGRPHTEDPNPSWLGDSIGHWDGDTFVIDTVGLNGKAWLDESGLPTTEALHVIERISRPDYGHLVIENIIDDPKAYTKPWSFTTHPVMLKGELMEYICQENNRDVEHLMGKVVLRSLLFFVQDEQLVFDRKYVRNFVGESADQLFVELIVDDAF